MHIFVLFYSEEACGFASKTIAHNGVAPGESLAISDVYDAWVERTQPDDVKIILTDDEDR